MQLHGQLFDRTLDCQSPSLEPSVVGSVTILMATVGALP